jgi:predicted lipid-binding transport protein (Tim44 family)
MAAIGIIVALIAAAVGVVVGLLGGLAGVVMGLLGCALGLLLHLFPFVLICVGIIWLVRGSNRRKTAQLSSDRPNAAPPRIG